MKNCLIVASVLVVASFIPARAATYFDPLGDGALVGVGGGILDISSVEVNNTATDLIFKINLAGDPTATIGANTWLVLTPHRAATRRGMLGAGPSG